MVLGCDGSIVSTMIVNREGRFLAQAGSDGNQGTGLGLESSASMIVPAPEAGLLVFLRLAPSAVRSMVYDKVSQLVGPVGKMTMQ
jgi:hypothetical protein